MYANDVFKNKILETLDIQLERLRESKQIIFELIDNNKLIKNGDRILTFSFSNTVMYILKNLKMKKIDFSLVLV